MTKVTYKKEFTEGKYDETRTTAIYWETEDGKAYLLDSEDHEFLVGEARITSLKGQLWEETLKLDDKDKLSLTQRRILERMKGDE